MSAKNVEIACTRPPLLTLVRMILRSNIGAHNDINENGGMKVSFVSTHVWNIGWVPLNSNWIHSTLDKDCGSRSCWVVQHVAARVCSNDGNKDVDDLFGHAICRILQFRSTSERLDILSRHSLHSIEEDGSLGVSLENYERKDEGEDTAFVISLAWKAIQRALH